MNNKLIAALLGTALAGMTGSTYAQEITLGYVSPIAVQPGQQVINGAMEMATQELGWKWRLMDANLSADRQVSHVDTLLTLGIDAIASWSLDPNAVAGAYSRANEQGVPVIGVNSAGEGVTSSVWWAVSLCNDDSPHAQQAAWIAERAPGAQVIAMGGPPVPSIELMTSCFIEYAEKAGLEVVDRIDNTRDSAANASTLASDELLRFPDVKAFWSYNDQSALGIAAALAAADKPVYGAAGTDGVMVFGINGDIDAVDAVRQGRITGTWDTDPFATGLAAVLAMKDAIENPGAEHADLIVPSVLYTSENIDTWIDQHARPYTLDTVPLVK